jgi:hypothetical protein
MIADFLRDNQNRGMKIPEYEVGHGPGVDTRRKASVGFSDG